MRKYRYFRDTIHHYRVYAMSKTAAWMLIRNKCRLLNIQVPTFDQIEEE